MDTFITDYRPWFLAFTIAAALFAGYRPCKRCGPLRASGEAPEWLRPLLEEVERRVRDFHGILRGIRAETNT